MDSPSSPYRKGFLSFFSSLSKTTLFLPCIPPTTRGSFSVAVFYDNSAKESIDKILAKIKAKSFEPEYFKKEFARKTKEAKTALEREFDKLKAEYQTTLLEEEARLNTIYKLLFIQSALIAVDESYILQGWVPAGEKERFQNALSNSGIEFSDPGGIAPVLLKTPKLFQPFEELIENFSYPSYTEMNPTVLFAFTFLTMFGMMFGDIGHGAILVAIGYLLLRTGSKHKVLSKIMISSGLSAVMFGFLYGSVFGFHHILPHLLFSPMEDINTILLFSLVVGVSIITLSITLNIFSRYRENNIYHLFFGSGGLLWLIVYWFLIGIAIKINIYDLSVRVELYIVGAILTVLFIMFLYKSKNITKTVIETAMEVMEYATNTVSFIRLGAFTLSHAALFLALFSIADIISKSTHEGVGYWLTIVLGNIIIIVLEGVVVTIQTLRLEYYEFFKRFYRGGGEKYQPFILKGDYDEKNIHV